MVQVVRVARTTSLDDMHSENIWFSWYKPSKYREKLICHAFDGRTDERKVENRAVFCWTRNRNDSEAHRVVMVIMMVIFTLELEKNVKKDFIRQASSQCIGVGLAQTRTQGLRNSYGE